MMWTKGQPWRVAGALQKLYEQIRAHAPRAVPPATDVTAWGSIADNAHSSSSDHYPHLYAALGATAVVCARDFPHAPALGLDGHAVTEALRASRDSRIGYIIFDRHITGPNHGWRWDHYDGADPHDTHFHVSTVHTAAADDPKAWALPGGPSAASTGGSMFVVQRTGDAAQYLVGLPGGPLHYGPSLIAPLAVLPHVTLPNSAQGAADLAAILAGAKPPKPPTVQPSPEQWQALIDAVGPAAAGAVKDQFGPAFDARITAATRSGIQGATLHAAE